MNLPSPPRWCPDDLQRDLLDLAWGAGLEAPLPLPDAVAAAARAAGAVELTDAEGTPIARCPVSADGRPRWADAEHVAGGAPRPFERLFLTPAAVRAGAAPGERPVLVDRPLRDADVAALAATGTPTLLLVPAGPTRAAHNPAWATLRAAEAAAARLPATRVVALPVPASEPVPAAVLAAYGAPAALPLPAARGAAGDVPRGAVVLFTGLSGAGKSTIARAVHDALAETSDTPVTLLDGDVVRRNLSAELGFTAADRETNIRRIGWVAAAIAHHGGVVLCSPIAPYAATRAEVRLAARRAGCAFLLVHVATPLTECERRDRKGMYARARAGEIADFTGVSAPYEAPADAELVIDTTGRPVTDCRDAVLDALAQLS